MRLIIPTRCLELCELEFPLLICVVLFHFYFKGKQNFVICRLSLFDVIEIPSSYFYVKLKKRAPILIYTIIPC